MRNYNTLLLCLLGMAGTLSLFAQRNCGTMQVHDRLLNSHPGMRPEMERIERFTQRYQNEAVQLRGLVTIPVVVHILYNQDAENISDEQVHAQLEVLNADFRRLNADAAHTPAIFQAIAADTGIEFCLAGLDPEGRPTSGIRRRFTDRHSFRLDDAVKFDARGGLDAWPSDRYLNIWVCDIGGGILGYAQFPGGPPATDGVVIDYLSFGAGRAAAAPFHLGRTATHEVGHWLNLRHIWGDGDCGADDLVADTPPADGPNFNGGECRFPGRNSCRDDGLPDMFQNFMDYSEDACMNLFTLGQSSRMNALLAPGGFREGLARSPACGRQGLPGEVCDNGRDDDGDGRIDCGDDDCRTAAPCAPALTCQTPAGLFVDQIRDRSARLSWTAVDGAAAYLIQARPLGEKAWTEGQVYTNEVHYLQLQEGVRYQWRVSALCGETPGDFSGSCTFTAGRPGSGTCGNDKVSGRQALGRLRVYPNPAREVLHVQFPAFAASENRPQQLQLVDLRGHPCRQQPLDPGQGEAAVDLSGLPPGLYLLKVHGKNGRLLEVEKVVVGF